MTAICGQRSEIGNNNPVASKSLALGTMLSALSFLGALLFALCVFVEAQQPKKIPRVGFLVPGSPSAYSTYGEAFRQGLRDLRYTEGKDIAVEYRYHERSFDQLAAELVRLNVDVIVTGGPAPIRATKRATNTIPIVVVVADAVRLGFVSALRDPAGTSPACPS